MHAMNAGREAAETRNLEKLPHSLANKRVLTVLAGAPTI